MGLQLIGGPKCKPPVSYQGSKRGYAHAILQALGLTPGQGADAVLLVDPGPWSKVWAVLATPEGCRAVAATIRGWIGEEPRALWNRLKAEGPLDGSDAARWLWVTGNAYAGLPEGGWKPVPAKRPNTEANLSAEGLANAVDAIAGDVAHYLMLSASNRLICCDWHDGVWKNNGAGGTTHGGEEFATPADKVAGAADAVAGVRWPMTLIGSMLAADVDPVEVAKWLLLHRWSFSARGPAHGYGGPGCEVRTERATWTTAGRDACLERHKLAERVEAIGRVPPAGYYCGSAADVEPVGDLSNCIVYIDPPYGKATGYKHQFSRESVIEVARRWAACGATVCISEAEPLTELAGWHTLDISQTRKGQKRTFSKQQGEWLTCNQPLHPLLTTDNHRVTRPKQPTYTGSSMPPRRTTAAEPLYVSHIAANLKTGVNADLGRLTVLVGPNGSGKSSYTQAVELALRGDASDITGRALVRDAGALMALAPGVPLLFAKATLSNGQTAEWQAEQGPDGRVKEPKPIVPFKVRFPVRDVTDHLTGSVDKAREFLLVKAAASVSREDVQRRMGTRADAYEAAARRWTGLDEVSILLRVWEKADQDVRALRKEAGTIREVSEVTGGGLAPEPTDAQIADAELEVVAAKSTWVDAIETGAVRGVVGDIATLREAAEQAVAGWRAADAAYREQAALYQPVDAQAESVGALLETVSAVIDQHVEHNLLECLVCGGGFAANRVGMYAELLQGFRERRAAVGHLSTLLAAVDQAYAQAMTAVNVLQVAEQADQDAAGGLSREEAAARLQEAEAALLALRQTAAAWTTVRGAEAQAQHREDNVDTAQALADACSDACGRLLDTAVADFSQRVQAFLPPTDVFALRLRDGKREVCRFGFLRDGALHTALSGAEWARLMLAMACACTDVTPDIVNVFLLPDRAFDPDTLRAVLVALKDAPGQVLVTSTVLPSKKLPAGWTKIETGLTDTRTLRVPLDGRVPADPEPQIVDNGNSHFGGESEEEDAGREESPPVAEAVETGSEPVARDHSEAFRTLGWTPEQIARLNDNARITVLYQKLAGKSYAILKDGSLFDLGKSRIVSGTTSSAKLPPEWIQAVVGGA